MSSRLVLVVCLLVTAAIVIAAQPPAPSKPASDPQQRPTFRTEANFIRVDVFPTINGVPVRDLTAADFVIEEDGVPQKVETFEFVQVRSGGPQELRDEPNTIQESRDALKNPRARVFVLFLDVPHVRMHGAWNVREPLIRVLDRVMGEEDLVGIMTPGMAASDVVFARKTQVIAGGLRDRWPWGERFTLAEDQREVLYRSCYPWPETDDVVVEMRARRKERMTLDALQELVLWLRTQREERKAVITISEGWQLFKRNPDLTRPRGLPGGGTEPIPGPEPVGVGPDGRLRLGEPHPLRPGTKTECDRDRQYLSQIDNDRFFRDIIDDANRANASFYTVDPRGLAAFDAPIGPAAPPPPSVDLNNLRRRIDTLRVLAENTDGLAAVNSNDIDASLKRISDDLTSYYLLGYYSTNTKLDGRFRRIKVAVSRPGVKVRARRGYRAATQDEVAAAAAAAQAPLPESVTAARTALQSLARLRSTSPLRTRAVVQRSPNTVWVAGEFTSPAKTATAAEIAVIAGSKTITATAPVAAGQRSFLAAVPLDETVPDTVDVRVRIPGIEVVPLTDMMRAPGGEGLPHPVLFRRGPTTGNRLQPAGEPLFSRTERARLEVPLSAGVSVTGGRVLDRNGTAVDLPVAVTERTDPNGLRWATADITLAPLGGGDYVIELTGRAEGIEQMVLTAIRITR